MQQIHRKKKRGHGGVGGVVFLMSRIPYTGHHAREGNMVTQSSPNYYADQALKIKRNSEFFIFQTLENAMVNYALHAGLVIGVRGHSVQEPVQPHHVEHQGQGGDNEEIKKLAQLNSEGSLRIFLLELLAEGHRTCKEL